MSRSSALRTDARADAAASLQREFGYGPEDFAEIARLLEERTGIHLPPHKDQLVYSRLAKRLRALGLNDFPAYRAHLASPDGGAELMRMVNALTTNLTRFFRELHHFQHLRAQLQALVAARQTTRRLRIWSAGCSTGPEPYSIAMVVAAAVPDLQRWDAKILATDIDTDVLTVAREGRYAVEALADLPHEYRRFARDRGDGDLEIAPEVRGLVHFKPLNLVGPWPMKGPFDAIFCRNVAIYFTQPTQTRLFSRFHELIGADGILYIGHSETLNQLSDRFELIGQTIYRPR